TGTTEEFHCAQVARVGGDESRRAGDPGRRIPVSAGRPGRLGRPAPSGSRRSTIAPRTDCSRHHFGLTMFAFLLRRIVFGIAVLIGTSIITFAIAFVIPADPAVTMAGAKADPQTLATIRHELGLDLPVYLQYARYLDRALHGDLGRSYVRRDSVAHLIASRF